MKFFNKIELPMARAIASDQIDWCCMSLGKPVNGGNWWRHRGHLYFKDEKAYMMYALRWE
jgi:hypothetical protein